MKRRTKVLLGIGIIIAGVGIAAIIFGPYVYRDLIVGTAPGAPSVDTASSQPLDPETANGTWAVSEGSYAGYRVKEVLRGVDVTIVGRTSDVTGTVTLTAGQLSSGEVTVDVSTIATDEPARDSYFRSNVIQSQQYPTASFTIQGPLDIPASAFTTTKAQGQLTGTLTLHGVRRDVTIAVEGFYDGTFVQIAGSFPVTWSDYGITSPSLGFAEVETSGSIEFLLKLKK